MKATPFHGLTFRQCPWSPALTGAAQPVHRSFHPPCPTPDTPARGQVAGVGDFPLSLLGMSVSDRKPSQDRDAQGSVPPACTLPPTDTHPPDRPWGKLFPQVSGSTDGKACPASSPPDASTKEPFVLKPTCELSQPRPGETLSGEVRPISPLLGGNHWWELEGCMGGNHGAGSHQAPWRDGKGPPRSARDWVHGAPPGQALGARAACKQMASRLRKPLPACRCSPRELRFRKQQLLNLTETLPTKSPKTQVIHKYVSQMRRTCVHVSGAGPRGISSDFQSRGVNPSAQTRAHSRALRLTAPRAVPCHLAALGHYRAHLSCGTKRVPTRPGAQAGRGPQGAESVCVEGRPTGASARSGGPRRRVREADLDRPLEPQPLGKQSPDRVRPTPPASRRPTLCETPVRAHTCVFRELPSSCREPSSPSCAVGRPNTGPDLWGMGDLRHQQGGQT